MERKSYGQYFTPEIVADFMTKLISKPKLATILEPCAGKGIFLKVLSENGYSNIQAFELDSSLPNESSVKITYADFLSTDKNEQFDVVIGNPPYVRWKNLPKKIQEQLRNDPYWMARINGLSDLLYAFIHLCIDKLRKGGELIFITPFFWTETLHARNLRHYMLEQGDLETFITFNEMPIFKNGASSVIIFKFVKKKTYKPIKVVHLWSKKKLRKQMLNNISQLLQRLETGEKYIKEDYFEAYKHTQFPNCQPWKMIPGHILPLITTIENSTLESAPIVEVKLKGIPIKLPISQLLEISDLEKLDISKQFCKKVKFAGKPYFVLSNPNLTLSRFLTKDIHKDGENQTVLSRIERNVRLGDIADIGNGMVSGLDRAFKVGDITKFTEKERRHLISVVKASDIRQLFFVKTTPYIFVNCIKQEQTLKNDFPNIWNQLVEHKDRLSRRYNYNRDIPWWHWVFLRNQKLFEKNDEKIFTPCKDRIDGRGHTRFAYVNGKIYPTQDVTAIVKKNEFRESTKYVLALLNSNAIFLWLKYKGLRRGGVLEFSEKPLSRIPIRLINWHDKKEVAIHDEIVNLVDLIIKTNQTGDYIKQIDKVVSGLYGLNLPVISSRNGFLNSPN